jgi:hypothetical protein
MPGIIKGEIFSKLSLGQKKEFLLDILPGR